MNGLAGRCRGWYPNCFSRLGYFSFAFGAIGRNGSLATIPGRFVDTSRPHAHAWSPAWRGLPMRFAATVISVLAVAACSSPLLTTNGSAGTLTGRITRVSTSATGAITAIFVDGSSSQDGDLACDETGIVRGRLGHRVLRGWARDDGAHPAGRRSCHCHVTRDRPQLVSGTECRRPHRNRDRPRQLTPHARHRTPQNRIAE